MIAKKINKIFLAVDGTHEFCSCFFRKNNVKDTVRGHGIKIMVSLNSEGILYKLLEESRQKATLKKQ